jgi:hypothetical protein
MGDQDSLLEVQQELREIGQDAYQFEQRCPQCQDQFKECWERLDGVDQKLQRLSLIEKSYSFLQYKVDRHLDFGEPLD